MDTEDIIENLPVDKNTKGTLYFLLGGLALVVFGGTIAIKSKAYIDDWRAEQKADLDVWHHDLLAQLDQSSHENDTKIQALTQTCASNTNAIEAIRKYYVPYRDLTAWASKLDHANRTPGQPLAVPDVPTPFGQ